MHRGEGGMHVHPVHPPWVRPCCCSGSMLLMSYGIKRRRDHLEIVLLSQQKAHYIFTKGFCTTLGWSRNASAEFRKILNVTKYFWEFREFANNINHIGVHVIFL
jgi:hypothetical protein